MRSQPPLHSMGSRLVRHSPVFTTSLFPGGSDPSYLSFPKACPATVVCCLWSRVLWPVSCTRVAPVFSRLVSCTLRFLVVITASSCSSGLLCVSASFVTRSWVLWNAMGVASGEFVSLLSSEPHVELSSAETTDPYVRSLNHVVPSASMIWLCPRTLLLDSLSALVSHAYHLLWLSIAFSLLCPLTVSESVSELSIQPSESWF